MIITDNNAVIKINCFAEYFALSLEPCPINWAATTAPPVPNAAKILINKILIASTSETADTAASPTLATITVSAKPTVITNSCSTTKGIINFFNALLSNNIPHAPYSYLLYAHILLNKVNFIFWKSKKTSQMRSKNKLLV